MVVLASVRLLLCYPSFAHALEWHRQPCTLQAMPGMHEVVGLTHLFPRLLQAYRALRPKTTKQLQVSTNAGLAAIARWLAQSTTGGAHTATDNAELLCAVEQLEREVCVSGQAAQDQQAAAVAALARQARVAGRDVTAAALAAAQADAQPAHNGDPLACLAEAAADAAAAAAAASDAAAAAALHGGGPPPAAAATVLAAAAAVAAAPADVASLAATVTELVKVVQQQQQQMQQQLQKVAGVGSSSK